MIFTARQLEEMQKSDGQITLPYRARLTPLAQDWVRHRGLKVGYADIDKPADRSAGKNDAGGPSQSIGTKWLWWCDGPCGPAKAALGSAARDAGAQMTEVGVDAKRIVEAIKIIAREVKNKRAEGAVMLVSNGALAMVYANRCKSLRAVLGTCLEAVDQGVRIVGANVLVVEHPYKSLQQAKTLLSRFFRGKREFSEDVQRQLKELSDCE
jgi:ribose 5-phosphate isomerase RpiB